MYLVFLCFQLFLNYVTIYYRNYIIVSLEYCWSIILVNWVKLLMECWPQKLLVTRRAVAHTHTPITLITNTNTHTPSWHTHTPSSHTHTLITNTYTHNHHKHTHTPPHDTYTHALITHTHTNPNHTHTHIVINVICYINNCCSCLVNLNYSCGQFALVIVFSLLLSVWTVWGDWYFYVRFIR